MVNQDLGRVCVVLRGEYDPTASYERLDCVSYQGSSYLVRKHCIGVAPAEGEYYQIAAKAGADGKDAVTPEQIAEIAQSAAEILQPDVSQIKDDLAAEQNAREQADASLQQDISGKLPKSPADWESWTAEEQAAARERIGIPGDYDLIEEIICDGKASIYNRDVEPDGNPYTFRSIYIELEIQPSNVYSGVFFRAYVDDGSAVLYDGGSTTNKSYTSYMFAGCDRCSGFYRGWMVATNIDESNNGGAATKRINKPQAIASPIKRVLVNHNGGVLFNGDKIRIYGVRA